MRNIFTSLLLALLCLTGTAQLKSPDDFLGYALGTKYTPHHKIVRYFEQAAAAAPSMMKLEQYGETSEGRPLLLAFIASPENLNRLEEIRLNNLRTAGLLQDKPAVKGAPAIVWLSYNVHGNETSSSEVSMKALYELLQAGNTATKEYLKNLVVIIDPCINPDGRDRYVNWVTQMMGRKVNPDPNSREHSEPWPGGRYNHYGFDLNRDWAWQTQLETRQRMMRYQQWMPQVHSDYHEQGYNNPYYFAPAAQPYHEVITPWQRDFQVEIGRNNARYFDEKGWLYFTREVFDLFYPSYGDTYPIYNGGIGMTFEQGGGSRSSAAVVTSNGDTLTLKDRIDHHFTTTMSTLEVVSRNAAKVVDEFRIFFDKTSREGVGDYKSFVITDVNTNKINALKRLLDSNHITYQTSATATAKGLNYFTRKEETFNAANAMVISTYQPKGVLAKVLFEPASRLVDSATYDITAWALPYVYGLQGYAVKEKLAVKPFEARKAEAPMGETNYGYLVRYASFEDARFLSAILRAGVRVRFAEKDFTYEKISYRRGALIILKAGNEGRLAQVAAAAARFDVKITPIATGFMDVGADFGSEKVHYISRPRVAMLTGRTVSPEAAGEVWHLFDQELDYPISLINAEDIANINWRNFDVLILPNGRYKFLAEKEGSADLKSWLRQGGRLIAMENAVAEMSGGDWGIKMKKEDEEKKDRPLTYAELKRFEENEHKGIMSNIAGAIFKLSLDDSHPLALGFPGYYFNLKMDGNMYEFLKDGWNVGVITDDSYVAGFVGANLKDQLRNGLSVGVQDFGRGSIVYLADDPIFRNFWENGKLLFSNAVFLVGQ